MRAYFQLFFGLLIPLTILFVITSIVYFRIDYDFTKAMRIGVLTGFFIGITASTVIAFFLLIMRMGKKSQNNIFKNTKKFQKISNQELTKKSQIEILPITKSVTGSNKTIEQKIILLMDKELVFEVVLYAISDQNIGTLTENKHDESLTIKAKNEVVHLSISTLTRHTAQVTLTSNINSPSTKKIITYLKEKEYSFLQY